VLFALAVAWIAGEDSNAATVATSLITIAGGGVLCGLAVAGGLLLVAGRSDDHLVEIALTMLAAYGSFLIAEKFHVSGVLATLASGMLVGNWGRGKRLTEQGGEAMIRFWDFAAFLANSVVFLLIGSREATEPLGVVLIPAAIGTALVLAGRVIAVYPITALFRRTPLATSRITQHILFWGGLRGALALALALAAPEALPEHDALIGVAFAVVAFSIFVQGLTVPRLLKHA